MKVAYLTNQYPHFRHTFIRREILGLEEQGIAIERFSVRPAPADLVDPADIAEQKKTQVLLRRGAFGLVGALLRAIFLRPGRLLKAARLATCMGLRSERGLLRHAAYLAEACLLREHLRARGAQHLHVHFGTNPAAVALLCRLLGGPPYSLTIHGSEEWDRPENLSLREKYENASFIASVSEYGSCQIYRWCDHRHWSKVHLVRCGLDALFLGVGPQPVPETNRLVTIGALVAEKGHLRLLEALSRLAASGRSFEMVLVGDGPMRDVIEAESRRVGLAGRIRITGWLSNQAVRKILLESRVMVLPSFAENLPVVIMEALALGRPAISSRIAGIPELVEHGVSGWLVPAGSVDALTRALGEALDAPRSKLDAMGRAGAARVATQHAASKEAAQLAGLFRSYVQTME